MISDKCVQFVISIMIKTELFHHPEDSLVPPHPIPVCLSLSLTADHALI